MANKKQKKQNIGQRSMSKAQMEARELAAEEKRLRAEEQKAAAERGKKIFTVVVCIILVLALGIPSVALSVLQFG